MERPRQARNDKSEHRHRRSRSASDDSEAEHRRRRQRREREPREDGRSSQGDGRERRHESRRDGYDRPERKRRRSRSPDQYSSTYRHDDRHSKHRSPQRRSPEPRTNSRAEERPVNDDFGRQVGWKKSGPLPSQEVSFSKVKDPSLALVPHDGKPAPEKQKPNFAPTGLLAAASNSIAAADGTSIVLKYHEPPEARKPPARDQWKLFVFKGADIIETVDLSLRSCWLVGRELAVVDLAAEHPSISKQHAVIQFRWIEKRNEFGDKLGKVRPYLIDLESANGTMLNKETVPGSRYLEIRDKDMIQFGDSTREYVLMLPPKD